MFEGSQELLEGRGEKAIFSTILACDFGNRSNVGSCALGIALDDVLDDERRWR